MPQWKGTMEKETSTGTFLPCCAQYSELTQVRTTRHSNHWVFYWTITEVVWAEIYNHLIMAGF